jgi:hypothetical protein
MAQLTILTGMTGTEVREVHNNNYDELYDAKDSFRQYGKNILSYGGIGDGKTDDTVAFSNAMSAVIDTNSTLVLPEGVYLISELTFDISNKKIKIIGSGNSVIKSANKSLTIRGVNGNSDIITANITKGDDVVATTSLYSSVVAGDLLQVISTMEYANVGVSGHYKGEIVEVLRVSGDLIYLKSKFYDSYTIAEASIRKMNAGSLEITGVKFEDTRLTCYNLNRSSFVNLDFTTGNIAGLEVYTSKNILIQCIQAERSNVELSGSHYGILTAESQNVTIRDCFVSNYSQGIIAGGKYPTRDYIVVNNRIQNENTGDTAQIDTHTNCENIQIIGNTLINGGIYCKGCNILISNNILDGKIEIYREDLIDDLVHELHLTDYLNVFNNVCSTIWIGLSTYRDIIPIINVIGNTVTSTNSYAFLYYSDHSTDCVIKDFNIVDNYFASNTSDALCYTVYFAGSTSMINNVQFKNNVVKSTNYRPFFIANGAVIELLDVGSCYFSTSGVQNHVYAHGVQKSIFRDNTFDKTTLDFANTHAVALGNVFVGIASGGILKLPDDELNSLTEANTIYMN